MRASGTLTIKAAEYSLSIAKLAKPPFYAAFKDIFDQHEQIGAMNRMGSHSTPQSQYQSKSSGQCNPLIAELGRRCKDTADHGITFYEFSPNIPMMNIWVENVENDK
jgi:hypothetical protein